MRPCDGFVTFKSCVIGEGGNYPMHTQNPLHPVLKGNQHLALSFPTRMPGIDSMIVSCAQWTRMAFVKAPENRSGKKL
jgi:hypothetical protein